MSAEEKKKEIVAKAAAVGYRRCSYNPADDAYVADLDGFRGEANNKAVNLYVNGRVKWFLTYCEENGVKGRIEEADVTILPEFPRLMMVTSRIYMNDELVADGIAGAIINPEDPNCAVVVQSCATKAKGRALANAGFNLNGIEDASDLVAPDTGVRLPTYMISGGQIVANPDNPVDATFVAANDDRLPFEEAFSSPAAGTAPETTPEPAPVPRAAPKKESKKPMTLAEAQAFVIPMGTAKGKTVGEAALTNIGVLRFYAGRSTTQFDSAEKYADLVSACTMVLDHLDNR